MFDAVTSCRLGIARQKLLLILVLVYEFAATSRQITGWASYLLVRKHRASFRVGCKHGRDGVRELAEMEQFLLTTLYGQKRRTYRKLHAKKMFDD